MISTNCTFITSWPDPFPWHLLPQHQMLGASGITIIIQVLVYSGPTFRSTKCKLSQLANSDIQINQLALARCNVFSQFFKLLSKMFIVCWTLNNIKRGNKRFDSPSYLVHNQPIFNTDILTLCSLYATINPRKVLSPVWSRSFEARLLAKR